MVENRNRGLGHTVGMREARRAPGARRRGQALLLAVLLMIFAALLGSTFITVVALNLNHAGREQDMSSAATASQAGLIVTNQSLTTSVAGEDWRPEMVSPPPDKNDGDYTLYYTPLERAQGWARTTPKASNTDVNSTAGVTGGDWDHDGSFDPIKDDWAKLNYDKEHGISSPPIPARVFVKFPDPRLQPSSTSTPTYLVEVKYLPTVDNTHYQIDRTESSDKYGKLRITVIGEAQDNTNVFTQHVSYKSTSITGGPMSYAYYVSNWDNNNNRLISTKLANVTASGAPGFNSITVQNPSGITKGRMLIIHDANSTPAPADTVVTVQSVSGPTIKLDKTYTVAPSFAVGSLVQAASPLMQNLIGGSDTTGTKMFDSTGSGTPTANAYDSTQPDAFQTSQAYSGVTSNGMFYNASLAPQQKSQLNLNSAAGSFLKITGLLAANNTTTQQVSDNGGTLQSIVAAATPAPSATVAPVQYNPNPQSTDLGANPVQTITPPKIDGQRYLQLTKYSDVANGSAYGYGSGNPTGIYIDNANDFEKVATQNSAGVSTYRALSIAELQRFWQRKSFPAAPVTGTSNPDLAPNVPPGTSAGGITIPPGPDEYSRYRLTYASHAITPTQDSYTYPNLAGSLEEQGIRGWVSPYEFRPRGVLIELNKAANTITITRDQNSDAFPTTADPNQAWRDKSGTLLTGAGAYTMVIDLNNGTRTVASTPPYKATVPFNGVIYAEGDARIRGALGTPSRSLTVVSMGNIYVEGELDQGRDAASKPTYIALLAKKNVTLNPTQFFVQSVDPAVVNTATPIPATIPASRVVAGDVAPFTAANLKTKEWFYNLNNKSVRLARNLHFNMFDLTQQVVDPSKDNLYLAMQHSAQFKQAATLKYNPTPGAPVMTVAAKNPAAANDPAIDSTRKHLVATIKSGTDTIPNSSKFDEDLLTIDPSATPSPTGNDTANTIAKLQQQKPFQDTAGTMGTPTPAPWTIIAKDSNGSDTSLIPARRLAQFSAPGGIDWNNGDTNPLIFTTSVGAYWNPGNTNAVDLTQPPVNGLGFTIGSSFRYTAQPTPYPSSDQRYFEDLAGSQVNPTPSPPAPLSFYQSSVNENFYWSRNVVNQPQAYMRWSSYRLNDGNSGVPLLGDNLLLFSRDQNEIDPNAPAAASLPDYRIGGFKIERGMNFKTPWSAISNFATNAIGSPNNEQAIQVIVQATIFAQDGSWFVIPQPLSPLVDVTGTIAPGTPINNLTSLAAQISLAATTHYRRPNYQVYVQGTVAQNYVPTGENDIDLEQDPDGHTGGAMAAWIDAMAYPHDLVPIKAGDLNTLAGQQWRSIAYMADPIPPNSGLYMPVSPDVDLTG